MSRAAVGCAFAPVPDSALRVQTQRANDPRLAEDCIVSATCSASRGVSGLCHRQRQITRRISSETTSVDPRSPTVVRLGRLRTGTMLARVGCWGRPTGRERMPFAQVELPRTPVLSPRVPAIAHLRTTT